MLEAVCLSCGQTAVIADEDDLEHIEESDSGKPCGGKLVRTGGWVMTP